MGQFATRLSAVEGHAPPPLPSTGAAPLYGMPGCGGLPAAPPSSSTVVHASSSRDLPITQIQFPHSPSPIPAAGASPSAGHTASEDETEGVDVPRFYKLSFPAFDGKEDPLGWLNRCEHFFRSQRTRESDKVWLASFHMTGTAQQWYYMLERDVGVLPWSDFKELCHQRFFGPAVGRNHLADLARLSFHTNVAAYQEAFQASMAHAGYLTLAQQVQLFTGGLPEQIRVD